ncbi:MAG: hypothetical protein ACYC3S_09395 [Chloroflexota bacterium]
MRYIRVQGIFEVDDKTDPESFLEKLGAWAEEKDRRGGREGLGRHAVQAGQVTRLGRMT